MKHTLNNSVIDIKLNSNQENKHIAENYLYNLLYAGKITLKEYLKQLKQLEQQKVA